jgi:CHASE3 domain sensor protein
MNIVLFLIKYKNQVILGLFLLGLTLFGYYIKSLFRQNTELKQQIIKLEVSLKTREDVILKIQKNYKLLQEKRKAIEKVTDMEVKKKEEVIKKIQRTGKKSIGEIALKKQKLVEKLVNNATTELFQCLEKTSKGETC